ncbi:MAG: tRNA (adenosine(37)-N6)-threonylcarbamoyltransferase complex dimerization subunit type 1 TsaB [Vulcanimicrobiaceae bacterium]
MHEPILALEGALDGFSVALLREGDIEAESLTKQAALESGLRLVRSRLVAGKLRLGDLGGVAVGTGPGGFTGLRIAIAFAKSLAFSAKLPLAGVSSFDILDAGANAESHLPRVTIVCGRPGIACMRRTDREGTRVACGPIAATLARVSSKSEEIAIIAATEDVRSAALERGLSVLLITAGPELPAATLARIARMRTPAASVHEVAPDYGELPAAKLR